MYFYLGAVWDGESSRGWGVLLISRAVERGAVLSVEARIQQWNSNPSRIVMFIIIYRYHRHLPWKTKTKTERAELTAPTRPSPPKAGAMAYDALDHLTVPASTSRSSRFADPPRRVHGSRTEHNEKWYAGVPTSTHRHRRYCAWAQEMDGPVPYKHKYRKLRKPSRRLPVALSLVVGSTSILRCRDG